MVIRPVILVAARLLLRIVCFVGLLVGLVLGDSSRNTVLKLSFLAEDLRCFG